MNVMLHKRCAKFIYVIPEGLRELMSDISREVLRSQPEHIYTFIADYLDALMITRENARVAAKLVESITEIGTTIVELLQITGMSREQADKMAAIIQNAFRKYMATKSHQPHVEYTIEEEEKEEISIISEILDEYGEYCEHEQEAAEIIQKAFRNFRERHSREAELLSGMIDWRVAARSAIYLYRKSGVTNEEANRAATLIKAAYKGYYTRRIMQRLVDEGRKVYEEEETEKIEEEFETESSEQFDFTTEETTEETITDSRKLVQRFMDAIVCKVVPEDSGTFPGSSVVEKHETITEILREISEEPIKRSEEHVEDVEEKIQTSESAPTIEDTFPEGAGIRGSQTSFSSFLLEEPEQEAAEQSMVEPLISEPTVTEPEVSEQPSSAQQITDMAEETLTESLTQIEDKEDFLEKDFHVQSDEDEAEQTEITEISELTEATEPPTETTEVTETDEN